MKGAAQVPPPIRLPPPDIRKEHAIETYKSLTTTGVEAIKTALILNGGAAVAFITFLGNMISKNSPNIPHLKCALMLYLFGSGFAGLSLIFGYLLNLRVYNEVIRQWNERHRWLLYPAIGLVIASYCAFVVGSIVASVELSGTI